MHKKIDVMIVGAQKAGTTSLLRYLGEHPACIAHPQKEFAYFLDPSKYDGSYNKAFQKYYAGLKIDGSSKVIGKSAGLYSQEKALERLYQSNPDCQLIIILRNPVERAYSSYLMEKNYGSAKFEFAELPDLISKHKENDESWGFSFFIDYGLYARYIRNIYEFFPPEQVKIVLYRDLRSDALSVCREIFSFIGVDPEFKPAVDVKHNVTQKTRSHLYAKTLMSLLRSDSPVRKMLKAVVPDSKAYKYGDLLRQANRTKEKYESMDPQVRKFLVDFFKPHNDELEKLIDRDLSDWNK
jgi:hypothetical protein